MRLQLPSSKRSLVDKANSTVVGLVAISAIVVTFSLIASKVLWDQSRFQARIIAKKEVALDQLKANIVATETLTSSYQAFVQQQPNVIDGNAQGGTGQNDGDNAKIVLDALPSKYDFPALATSIEKILKGLGLSGSITGSDQQKEQGGVVGSNNPQPIEIPFDISVGTTYDHSNDLFERLQRSIRPVHIRSMSMRGSSENSVQVDISAKTYYQPEKRLDITQEAIQ